MARREFPKAVYVQIVKRATHPVHGIACEGCGLILGKKKWHVDHIKADGLEIDKSGKLTAEDGQLLGVECCHAPKTANDVAAIAEAKRREAKYLGVPTKSKVKIPTKPKEPKANPKLDYTTRRALYALAPVQERNP